MKQGNSMEKEEFVFFFFQQVGVQGKNGHYIQNLHKELIHFSKLTQNGL